VEVALGIGWMIVGFQTFDTNPEAREKGMIRVKAYSNSGMSQTSLRIPGEMPS